MSSIDFKSQINTLRKDMDLKFKQVYAEGRVELQQWEGEKRIMRNSTKADQVKFQELQNKFEEVRKVALQLQDKVRQQEAVIKKEFSAVSDLLVAQQDRLSQVEMKCDKLITFKRIYTQEADEPVHNKRSKYAKKLVNRPALISHTSSSTTSSTRSKSKMESTAEEIEAEEEYSRREAEREEAEMGDNVIILGSDDDVDIDDDDSEDSDYVLSEDDDEDAIDEQLRAEGEEDEVVYSTDEDASESEASEIKPSKAKKNTRRRK